MTYTQSPHLVISTINNSSFSDFVCTGENDDIIWQKAIDRVGNGIIEVKDGDYYWSNKVQRKGATIIGAGKDHTNIHWTGAEDTTMLELNQATRATMTGFTLDGDDTSGVIGIKSAARVSQNYFADITIKQCNTCLHQGESGEEIFDSLFDSCDFLDSVLGIYFTEYQLSFVSPEISRNTCGTKFIDNSNARFFSGAFSNNTNDLWIAGNTQNISFHGSWLEDSTDGIFYNDGVLRGAKLISFHGGRLSTAATDYIIDASKISGTLAFFGSHFVQGDGTSIEILGNEYAVIDYYGCKNELSSGAIVTRNPFNRTAVEENDFWVRENHSNSSVNILECSYTDTGAVSIHLPTYLMAKCVQITIKDSGGGAGTYNITIDTEGDETIDGAATKVISSNYGVVTLYSDGNNWLSK